MCERKGLLFHELLSRLRAIRQEFGDGADWYEMALQSAIHDEEVRFQREQAEETSSPA